MTISGLVTMIGPMNQGLIGLMVLIHPYTRTGDGMNQTISRIMRTVQNCSTLMGYGMMMIAKRSMALSVKQEKVYIQLYV
jgi:hypothetical protein